ncbi:DUF4038 domain-containing protein [Cohnella sp. JJ-181]|uniref:apiosidase-like domain-containing protein n=1 Tax=Cohnella rhizoplanae TaxID=2974897 RepID=UPI0022FF5C5E|nr:DUF4038 domain-containing protein [Cohnella sp. JJ-181]CAI6052202.1 hypothetical protein COHCIP112018_01523 [Cohnella sp. JJ-181]
MSIAIDPTKEFFLKDGKKFFYLGDTVWSVFSNATLEEWEAYLDYRRSQGFNAVQISILPIIHDRSESGLGLHPFRVKDDGSWDFSDIDRAFFERAALMVGMAVDRGFLPALVVLWGNYAPGNWMSRITEDRYVMPRELVKPYVEFVSATFSRYEPMYFISGDTNFEQEGADDYYLEAMHTIKRLEPDAIVAMHCGGSVVDLTDRLERDEALDYYAYQSSHGDDNQYETYAMALKLRDKPVRRPVMNVEPCYEGHGRGGKYGRYDAFMIRRAFWTSVLSGAATGFGYGAHGVWSWHRKGQAFNNEGYSMTPHDWRTALRFEGAWDAAFGKWLFERYDLFGWQPAQALLEADEPEIRVAASADRSGIAVYAPYARTLRLRTGPDRYRWEGFDLRTRYPFSPLARSGEGIAILELPEANSDVLYIGTRI